jgi:hypothetical protein
VRWERSHEQREHHFHGDIRNVFRLKFGKAREAVALFKEGIAIQKRLGLDWTSPLGCSLT